jgi:histidinol-phosphate phosphatase family protein
VSSPHAAVFLDRDGVIAELVWHDRDNAYEGAAHPERLALAAGAADGVKAIRAAGFITVVVSNQPAAAKGTATQAELAATHDRFVELLRAAGVELDAYRYCFHHPDDACACRKPHPGLLLQAADELGLDLRRSWMIGDADRDIEAGRRAGCRTILIENPQSAHRRAEASPADYRAPTLAAAAFIVAADA